MLNDYFYGMLTMIVQTDANNLVLKHMRSLKVCTTKKRIVEKMILPKTKTSTALTYLRKTGKIGIFMSGCGSKRRVYWGVL